MERRKAITAAAAASLTLLAGAAGITLNSGIVGANADDNVGQVSPVSGLTNPPITVYVDDPANAVTATPLVQPTDAPPVTASAASGYEDDDGRGDDDRYEDEDEGRYEEDDDDHEDEDHAEYEGAEDDD